MEGNGNGGAGDRIESYVLSEFVKQSSTGKPIAMTSNSVTLKLEEDDVAFVLGKFGVTKAKLANVSQCRLDVDEKKFLVTLSGTPEQRRRAHEYIDMVLAQRRGGIVQLNFDQPRSDMTVLQVPTECVGYVTGSSGKVLRNLEREWDTLMFFLNPSQELNSEATETLVIFGQRRGRIGAALKVMSAVEHKMKGHYVKDRRLIAPFLQDQFDSSSEGFILEQMTFEESDFSYALGKEGKTRKKLAKASGCILEYVGMVAVMVGEVDERARVKDYLDWLLLQRTGQCDVNTAGRNDVTIVPVQAKYVGWITGVQGKNFRKIEDDTGCYLFTNRSSGAKLEGEETEQILVFSHDRNSRERAERMILRSVDEKKDADANGSRLSRRDGDDRRDRGGRNRSRSPRRGGGGRSGRRDRSDSPPRRHRDDSPRRRDDRRDDNPRRRDDSPYRRRGDSPRGRNRRDDDRGGRGRGRSRDRR